MEILPKVHQVPGVTANAFLLVDPGGLALIDTGLPRSGPKILDYLASLGYAPDELKHILLTHADSDHVGSAAMLKQATGARLYASAMEAEAIAAGRFSRPLKLYGWKKLLFDISTKFFKPRPCPVDEILAHEDELPILGGLRAIETPGHTPGHLSFFIPGPGVLFCGDSLRSMNGRISISRGASTWDEALAKRSAQEQATLGARVLCAGHGPAIHDAEAAFGQLSFAG